MWAGTETAGLRLFGSALVTRAVAGRVRVGPGAQGLGLRLAGLRLQLRRRRRGVGESRAVTCSSEPNSHISLLRIRSERPSERVASGSLL